MGTAPITDRILAATRWVAQVVIPRPVVSFISRYLAPDQSDARSVWSLHVVWMAAHRCPGT